MDSALGCQLTATRDAPQRIVHLLGSGGFYGLERMLLDHCLHVPGKHQVWLLSGPDSLFQRFAAAGVEIRRCGGGLRELLQAIRQAQFDPAGPRLLINAHGFKGLVLGWLAACRFGLPLIATQHGFTPSNRKQRVYTWLTLQLCRTPQVKAVVCVADSIARLLRKAGVRGHKLHVLPNGLPASAGQPVGRPAAAPPAPLLGFVGRLSLEKGPDLFVELAIALCRRHPALSVVLLGEGPQRAELEARIAASGLCGRILLPGYQERMTDWLSALTVLVLSSRTEGTPMVLLEAMQLGTPIATFAVGGIPDVLIHEQSALLSPAEDLPDLITQTERLLNDPLLRQRLAERARQVQQERFHLPGQTARWDQLYRRAGNPSWH
ncbi:glycosyltransferase family 4 protein [Pseudomonas flexibilis]|uniref:Glycosyl transferase family 1 n=1 Tax=Pseudomonas flexibilis TaxID=706570 RepID=A0A0B3BSF2_9PSED|nr:glycosyltransferase family 4 protein [Pseudomonas flexibilis]KHO63981.1 glycosyl transferase family 1 [Pseudomonas flexibilis]SCY21672.1 Glycosyltransferase involved in cell wall bisynthesis [Pseudomonas flexibilis]